ncbi:MAG: hypothetical protein B7Y35_06965 [Sphingomonadales bacterium 28-64-96]|nr:MAG: hypothetical protein B7Y35_06965 [Sphingomonadales bacterium 28-64-96]
MPITYVSRHIRFFGPAALGTAVWFMARDAEESLRLLVAGVTFFAAHLIAMAELTLAAKHESFRRRAARGDEGLALIAVMTCAIVVVSATAVFALLNHHVRPGPLQMAVAVGSVPLGWLTVHTVFGFHYAHAWFGETDARETSGSGMIFPGGGEPQAWDFLYYSFVVGMTAQVSDVSVTTTRMRRLTLGHSVFSFFYNTVILALTVNAVVILAG